MSGAHQIAVVAKATGLRESFAKLTEIDLIAKMPLAVDKSPRAKQVAGRDFAGGDLGEITNVNKEAITRREAIRAAYVQELITRKWMELGGPASNMGLPLETSFPLLKGDAGYSIEFRGGTLNFNNDSSTITPAGVVHAVVRFEGYGLEMRQEKGDELYGTLSVQNPSIDQKVSLDITQLDVGWHSDDRTRPFSMILYEGAPTFLNIIATMVESDAGSGERDAARNAAAAAANMLFDQAVSAATSNGSDPSAVAIESYTKESGLESVAREWIGKGARDLLDTIFGLGDDPYSPGMLSISAAEMTQFKPLQQYRCWEDPRVIEYTHRVTVQGKDDNDDIGQITLLFSVKPA